MPASTPESNIQVRVRGKWSFDVVFIQKAENLIHFIILKQLLKNSSGFFGTIIYDMK
jgi:hypothetical protein